MANRIAFNANLIKMVEKDLEKKVVDHMDDIAIRAHSQIVSGTPVDTGQARAGWNFTLNRISEEVPSGNFQTPASEPDKRATKIGDYYHLSNFVNHIVFLNEGSSEQAPAKFVESAIAKAVSDAR